MSDKPSKIKILLSMFLVLSTVSFVRAQESLPAPSNLQFVGRTLYWDAVEGVTNYAVERRLVGTFVERSWAGPATQYTFTDMEDGALYRFSAQSVSGNDEDGY